MPLVLLFVLFIVVPLAELYVILQVGQAIGYGPTIAILLIDSLVGAMLLKAQSRAAWIRFREATSAGRIPAREVADGALIIMGGAFLLTPGFLTDILGVLLLLPPTRAIFRKTVVGVFARRNPVTYVGMKAAPHAERAWNERAERRRSSAQHDVVNGDYVEGSATDVTDDEPAPERRRLDP